MKKAKVAALASKVLSVKMPFTAATSGSTSEVMKPQAKNRTVTAANAGPAPAVDLSVAIRLSLTVIGPASVMPLVLDPVCPISALPTTLTDQKTDRPMGEPDAEPPPPRLDCPAGRRFRCPRNRRSRCCPACAEAGLGECCTPVDECQALARSPRRARARADDAGGEAPARLRLFRHRFPAQERLQDARGRAARQSRL